MKKYILPVLALSCLLLSLSFVNFIQKTAVSNSDRVADLLFQWTGSAPLHYIAKPDMEQAQIGEALIKKGWALKDGQKSSLISKYFVCTDCHNTVREDMDLLNPTPEARLEKASKDNLPYLQGTTFFGITNRETWYNQDYEKKYGSLVSSARDTLANAIQLCAKVCSSGRYLEQWELDAILHYFNTIDYKVSELQLSENQIAFLNIPEVSSMDKANFLKSQYSTISEASFLDVQSKKERKYGWDGNPKKGREIYIHSCLHCHAQDREVCQFKLDTTALSRKFLKLNIKKDNEHSIYNIVRQGTSAEFAAKAYMPHYTKERMSEQQLEDLVSYVMKKL